MHRFSCRSGESYNNFRQSFYHPVLKGSYIFLRKIRKNIKKRKHANGALDRFYQHEVDPDVPFEDAAGTVQVLIQEGRALALMGQRG